MNRALVTAAAATLLILLGPHAADAASAARSYANCTALNKDYAHGVGRPGARDHVTSGTPVTTFKVSAAVYNANRKSDRDRDGVSCEKK